MTPASLLELVRIALAGFLEALRTRTAATEFTTADFIRFLRGAFVSEVGVPGTSSRNAAIGRALSALAWLFGFRPVRKVTVVDDHGHRTTSMLWRVVVPLSAS